jgi:PAP2 superfamily
VPAERRWARPARDAAPPLLALALSPVVAAVAPGAERPLARMRRLIELERRLGLFFEPRVHAWFGARPPLIGALRVTYIVAHVPVALGVLAWTRRAHPHAFPQARDTFAATQALAAIGYVLAPTAPPRMVAGLGYDDRPRPGDHGLGRSIQSPYAAMPSAHTAFAVVAAGTVWSLAPSRRVRAAALLFPPAVIVEIIATGDHIWLDALGGLVVAGLGFAGARASHRLAGYLKRGS